MKALALAPLALASLLFTASSCKRQSVEAKVATPQQAPSAAALPAPPAPKPECKSLDEKCQALPETMLEVGNTGAWFRPPPSYTYAKEDSFSVAFASDQKAVMAFTTAASAEPDALLIAAQQLVTRLSVAKIQGNQLKARLKKPDSVLPSEGLELKLWEFERKNLGAAPELNGKPGVLLLIVTTSGQNVIVGAGFVVKPEAEAQAAAIMTAVQSLRGARN